MVEIAAAADSSLPRPVIEAAVDAVAPGGQALRQLALALSADPGALATGAPPVAGKLAAALIARGSAALTVPACTVCGRAGKPLFRGDAGSAVCQRCRSWQLAVACASCGKVRPRAGRDDAGQPACEVCYRRDDPRRHRQCGACGKTAPVAARLARDFLIWAGARGHCTPLTIPAPARATGPAISQDQRWTHVARLLDDAALDPTDRVAGSLLLLYGQPLSRIAAITTSQITRRDDTTFILLGRHDAPVPAPLAGAIAQLTRDGRSHRGIGSPTATTWLFPGHLPGRPITPSRLGERLRDIGIYAQTGRRAALLDLAAQLPAAVLADLLGLHENTAAKWISQAGGDWTRYAAELARNHPHQH